MLIIFISRYRIDFIFLFPFGVRISCVKQCIASEMCLLLLVNKWSIAKKKNKICDVSGVCKGKKTADYFKSEVKLPSCCLFDIQYKHWIDSTLVIQIVYIFCCVCECTLHGCWLRRQYHCVYKQWKTRISFVISV